MNLSRRIAPFFALLSAAPATAQVPAASFNAADVFVHTTGAVDRTIAWEFTALQEIQVTSIGVFDRGAPSPEPGLGAPHEVVIWDASGTALVQSTVPAGVSGVVVDGFRYVDVTPTTLPAGQNYLVGAFWPESPFDHIPDVVSSSVPVTYDPRVAFVQSHVKLFSFDFPDIPVSNEFATGGVNFLLLDGSTTNYCLSTANSTGGAAVISTAGTASIAQNNLTLLAQPVPNQNGIFFFGANQQQVPFGNGFLCVDGQLFRLDVELATGNVLSHAVDYGAPPASQQIAAGATWNFQAWFRDPAAGNANFDLSDALTLAFVP